MCPFGTALVLPLKGGGVSMRQWEKGASCSQQPLNTCIHFHWTRPLETQSLLSAVVTPILHNQRIAPHVSVRNFSVPIDTSTSYALLLPK